MAGPGAAVKYRAVLRQLAAVPARLSERSALAITRLWRANYAAGQDPYGAAWAPNAPSTIAHKGHGRVMQETGETMDETRAVPMAGAGVSLRTGPRAAWHLEATANRPARPVLPLRGVPPTWRQAMQRIAIEEARKAVARAR